MNGTVVMEKVLETFGWYDGGFPLEDVLRNWTFRQAYSILLQPLSLFDKQGFNLLDEKWDYAIVMDALRYDITRGVRVEGESFVRRRSPASATMEWVSRCIRHPRKDIVLVTANPYVSDIKIRELTGLHQPFYKNVAAWDIGWDTETRSTPPWRMLDISLKALKKYPDKRMLFWFLQPHAPFLGFNPEGVKLTNELREGILENRMGLNVWRALSAGLINRDETWDAYNKNFRIALHGGVYELLGHLEGDIVITSDHGNCFGEMGIVAHPQRVHISPLVDVPYARVIR